MSAVSSGPVLARHFPSLTTRSVLPSRYVTSNWASSAGCSPYTCCPNQAMLPAYQPGARVTASAFSPARTASVTSYAW